MKGKASTLQDRLELVRKFIKGSTVKELAAEYGLADSTVSNYLRIHINVNGKVISKPPVQSRELHLPGEVWRKIPIASKYLYEASNNGRIKGYAFRNPKIVIGSVRYGYYSIDYMNRSGKRIATLAHILIAKTFLPQRPSLKHVITHIDHDKWNNRPDNLKWILRKTAQTLSRQSPYMAMLSRRAKSMPEEKRRSQRYGKLTRKEVMNIKTKMHNGRSTRAVAAEYHITEMTVARIHRGDIWADVLPQLTRKRKVLKTVPVETRILIISQIKAGMYAKDIAAIHGFDPTTVGRIKKSLNHTT